MCLEITNVSCAAILDNIEYEDSQWKKQKAIRSRTSGSGAAITDSGIAQVGTRTGTKRDNQRQA